MALSPRNMNHKLWVMNIYDVIEIFQTGQLEWSLKDNYNNEKYIYNSDPTQNEKWWFEIRRWIAKDEQKAKIIKSKQLKQSWRKILNFSSTSGWLPVVSCRETSLFGRFRLEKSGINWRKAISFFLQFWIKYSHLGQTSADSAVRILSGNTVRYLTVKIKFKFEIQTLENPPDWKFQILPDRHHTTNRIRTALSADVWFGVI